MWPSQRGDENRKEASKGNSILDNYIKEKKASSQNTQSDYTAMG